MAVENGEWIMRGKDWDDPSRIKTWQELIRFVDEVGFLPLFANEVPGFSAEEQVSSLFWWTGDPEQDPWEWREIIARSGKVAYGKFFQQKSGFISLSWFPVFANYRRDGYDFDARWDDDLASIRHKKIMDQFDLEPEWSSHDLKQSAGFGKGGEKNFSGVVTELQMESYLVIRDFRKKVSKKGSEYGMPIAVYARPEDLWTSELIAAGYKEDPAESAKKMQEQLQKCWPDMTEKQLKKILR